MPEKLYDSLTDRIVADGYTSVAYPEKVSGRPVVRAFLNSAMPANPGSMTGEEMDRRWGGAFSEGDGSYAGERVSPSLLLDVVNDPANPLQLSPQAIAALNAPGGVNQMVKGDLEYAVKGGKTAWDGLIVPLLVRQGGQGSQKPQGDAVLAEIRATVERLDRTIKDLTATAERRLQGVEERIEMAHRRIDDGADVRHRDVAALATRLDTQGRDFLQYQQGADREFDLLEQRIVKLESGVPQQPTKPGSSPQSPPQPGAPEIFTRSGIFFVPSPDQPTHRLQLPSRGRYRRVELELTVELGPWFDKRPDGIHNLCWLAPGAHNPDRLCYANLRGPNRNLAYVSVHYGRRRDQDDVRLDGKLPRYFSPNVKLVFTYDAGLGETSFSLSDAETGTRLLDDSDVLPSPGPVFSRTGKPWVIDFGLKDEANDAPTFGWKYSDLVIRCFPE